MEIVSKYPCSFQIVGFCAIQLIALFVNRFPYISYNSHELEALVAFWLARHMFLGCPNDEISARVFPLVVHCLRR